MKYLLIVALWKAGDLVSIPMVRFDWAFLYPAYNRLMSWSSALDTKNQWWKSWVTVSDELDSDLD